MKHERIKPILQAICYACDYGKDTNIKAEELFGQLFPINQTMNNKHSIESMYAIIHTTLNILEELECSNVTIVKESSNQKQDSASMLNHVIKKN